jgi:hypothetical protein
MTKIFVGEEEEASGGRTGRPRTLQGVGLRLDPKSLVTPSGPSLVFTQPSSNKSNSVFAMTVEGGYPLTG